MFGVLEVWAECFFFCKTQSVGTIELGAHYEACYGTALNTLFFYGNQTLHFCTKTKFQPKFGFLSDILQQYLREIFHEN